MLAWLQEHGAPPTLDVVIEGETPANNPGEAQDKIRPYADAGVTWWIESRWTLPSREASTMQAVRDRLAAGPPRIY